MAHLSSSVAGNLLSVVGFQVHWTGGPLKFPTKNHPGTLNVPMSTGKQVDPQTQHPNVSWKGLNNYEHLVS